MTRAGFRLRLVLAVLLGTGALAAHALEVHAQQRVQPGGVGDTATGKPASLEGVAFDQRLGASLPLDTTLRDEDGNPVQLASYFGGKPVLLSFAYFECPMLCTIVFNGLISALRALPFAPGRDFEIVTLSFDPRDTAASARARKTATLAKLGNPTAAAGWHFLTGDEAAIRRITDAVGFRYSWDENTQQFAHASGVVVATPDGKVSHYFYGIDYPPRDIRLALVEASESKIGSPVDQLLLYCFHYDPASGRYSATALGIIRFAGALTLLVLVLFVAASLRRESRRNGPTNVARSVAS